jgi:hypothetical protein
MVKGYPLYYAWEKMLSRVPNKPLHSASRYAAVGDVTTAHAVRLSHLWDCPCSRAVRLGTVYCPDVSLLWSHNAVLIRYSGEPYRRWLL